MLNDDALIRRTNLKRVKKAYAWETYSQVAAAMQWGIAPYWRALVENDDKSFGEKVARRIEDALGFPRGWLDREGEPVPARVVPVSEPDDSRYKVHRWLFSESLFHTLHRLEPHELVRLENILRAALELPPLAVLGKGQEAA